MRGPKIKPLPLHVRRFTSYLDCFSDVNYPFYIVSYLFRSLGSVIALSIGSTLFQDTLRGSLRSHLSGVDADEVRITLIYSSSWIGLNCHVLQIVRRVRKSLSYIDELDPVTRTIVRSSYEEALHISLWFLVVLAAASSFFSFFIKETPLVRPRQ
jgi:hypothetical protein